MTKYICDKCGEEDIEEFSSFEFEDLTFDLCPECYTEMMVVLAIWLDRK